MIISIKHTKEVEELPISCSTCPFWEFGLCYVPANARDRSKLNGTYTTKRHKDCPIEVESSELVSLTEAAELLGITRQSVHGLIQRGTLDAYKVGNAWMIPRYSVEARMEMHNQ